MCESTRRIRATLLALTAFGALGALQCQRRSEIVLTDTEGRSFTAVCADDEKPCSLTHKSGPRAEPAGGVRLRAVGRLVGVCPDSDSPHLGDCRALTCAADSGCPPASDGADRGATGTCVGSFCVEPSHALGTEDAVLLCLAGTGLGHERADQVTRYALALNCGSPCRVPAPCRQP
jgi:hypothetical protein